MRLLYINPNASEAMTRSIERIARQACPGAEIAAVTNRDGPPAIEGPEDGAVAIPGLLELVRHAQADAVIVACFDDTGLAEARAIANCPVLGIGQASYVMAQLLGRRFSVVTSVAAAVPVIQGNIDVGGHAQSCTSVRASGLPVLTIEEGDEETRRHLADEIRRTRDRDRAEAVVLGCAGMAALAQDLSERTGMLLIDGVSAAAQLAQAVARYSKAA